MTSGRLGDALRIPTLLRTRAQVGRRRPSSPTRSTFHTGATQPALFEPVPIAGPRFHGRSATHSHRRERRRATEARAQHSFRNTPLGVILLSQTYPADVVAFCATPST